MSPITTTADAERTIDDLSSLLAKLSSLVEQETELVHAGRLRHAIDLCKAKAELASQLHASSETLRANAKFLQQAVPARCAALQRQQEAFHAIVKRNVVVLATAHAVSEGIMRRLSGDLARKASPQVYGASGRATAPNPKHGRPLAVSRTL
jgi:hypothetical protein